MIDPYIVIKRTIYHKLKLNLYASIGRVVHKLSTIRLLIVEPNRGHSLFNEGYGTKHAAYLSLPRAHPTERRGADRLSVEPLRSDQLARSRALPALSLEGGLYAL